jgi:hypothetical protein
MATELDEMEAATQPLIERTLTAMMREMLADYDADRIVKLPDDAGERVLSMLRQTYDTAMRMAGQPMIEDMKDCFPHLQTKQDADDLYDKMIEDYIERYGAAKVVQINQTTRLQIMDTIRRGQREGLSVPQISGLLREAIPQFSRRRAAVIARTETHGSSQYGSMRTAQTSTEPMVKKWNSTEDARTRTIFDDDRYDHLDADGQTVAMEQPFMIRTIMGTKEPIMFPGDPAASAGNVINCRCAVSFRRADRRRLPTGAVSTIRKPRPTNPDLLLSSALDKNPVFAENYDNSFDKAPELAWRAIRRSKDLRGMIKGEDGAFANFQNEISMGRHKMGTQAYKRVFRHEYGHILDDQMAKSNPNRTGDRQIFQAWDAIDDLVEDNKELEMARSGLFVGDKGGSARKISMTQKNNNDHQEARSAIRKKARDAGILDDPRAILRQNIPDLEPDDILGLFDFRGGDIDRSTAMDIAAAWQRRDVYKLLQSIPRNLDRRPTHSSGLAGLQDTFEAGTGGKIRIQFGHGESYYRDNMPSMRRRKMTKKIGARRYNAYGTAQAFANWFEAYGAPNPAQRELYRNLWPRTAASFEKMVEDYVGSAS